MTNPRVIIEPMFEGVAFAKSRQFETKKEAIAYYYELCYDHNIEVTGDCSGGIGHDFRITLEY
jgi:hypothetical protein